MHATHEGAENATAGAAAANEDATAKEGPKGRVDNAAVTYAGKVRVFAAGMMTDEGLRQVCPQAQP